MSNLTFRDAFESDIPVILELCRGGAAFPDRYPPLDLSDPGYLASFRAIDQDPNNRLIVAERDGEAIGTLQITFIPGMPDQGRWRGLLESVHVRADQRGKGTGTQMIKWAIERCRERNCWTVQLTSNKLRKDAHRFYEALGFEASHEGFKLTL